jgi:2-polyprenyl-3-methyl-5-hydroxy-6-metoxy-1,4-benzoquinol methylase
MADTLISYRGQTVDILEWMRRIVEHPLAERYSPWFFTYYRDLTGREYMSRYLRFLRKFVALYPGGVAGRKVLDAGCGFGIMATLVALLGAQEVHGLDCHQGMIDTFRTYLEILPERLPVYPRLGDVAAMPYADASFDLVLSHEAISHYRDGDAFLAEAWRVLRPGGALLLSDSNNARNRRVVRETWEIWRAFEQGPAGAEVHGHKIETPFVAQRAAIIAGEFPKLMPQEVNRLAQETAGLWGAELREAVERYLRMGTWPNRPYRQGECPVDPVQGYYIERLLDPYALKRRLQELGFRVALRAYLGGARGGWVARANDVLTWPPLTPLVLPWARSFRILALKAAG